MSPPRDNDSTGLYVAQRTFRRVMRGYDPDQVDAHLEKVRTWFTHSGLAQVAREHERRLDERETVLADRERFVESEAATARERAELVLRGATSEAEGTIVGARARTDADLHAGAARVRRRS